MKLKDRNRFTPGGFKFFQPETKWEAPKHVSFDQVVHALIAHRKGNPWLTTQHGWPTDFDTVANEVDAYNALLCKQMGWDGFIMEGEVGAAALPFHQPHPSPNPNRLKNVAEGASVLVEWLNSGSEAVPASLSEKRAGVCAQCPVNGKGDWTRWFTIPVSEAIRKAVEIKNQWKLSTPHDDKLGICTACDCPLPLKVHLPIHQIRNSLSPDALSRLHVTCWIPKE